MARSSGGRVELGTDDRFVALDNERPRHSVELAPFLIAAHPTTNGERLEFVEDGGNVTRRLWSEEGRLRGRIGHPHAITPLRTPVSGWTSIQPWPSTGSQKPPSSKASEASRTPFGAKGELRPT